MKAWLFQDSRQKQKLGDNCPWSVGWFEDGRKRGRKIGCRSMAEKSARKIENPGGGRSVLQKRQPKADGPFPRGVG